MLPAAPAAWPGRAGGDAQAALRCRPHSPFPFLRTTPGCQAKEITNNVAPEPFRWTAEGLLALQEATEDFIVHLLEDCNLCAIHAKRVTISAWAGGGAWGQVLSVLCEQLLVLLCHSGGCSAGGLPLLTAPACPGHMLQCQRTCSWRGGSVVPCTASARTEQRTGPSVAAVGTSFSQPARCPHAAACHHRHRARRPCILRHLDAAVSPTQSDAPT